VTKVTKIVTTMCDFTHAHQTFLIGIFTDLNALCGLATNRGKTLVESGAFLVISGG